MFLRISVKPLVFISWSGRRSARHLYVSSHFYCTDQIAEAIVFLAIDRASFIYGAKLAVDGRAHCNLK